MKKIIINLILISCSVILFSCNSNSPESATKSFFKHMYDGNFEKAKEYATTDTKSMLTMLETLGGKDQLTNKIKGEKLDYIITDTKIDGDKATCTLETTTGENKETTQVQLVKKDGKWLVSFGKEDMNKEGAKNKESNKPDTK